MGCLMPHTSSTSHRSRLCGCPASAHQCPTLHTFVGNALMAISQNGWSAGGELCYSHSQRAPGLSFGCRWVDGPEDSRTSVFTSTLNPITGHLTSTFTSVVTDSLTMSARYEYNLHSHETELSGGIELQEPNNPFSLKLRVDSAQGLGIILQAHLAKFDFSVGCSLSSLRPLPDKAVTSTIGCSLQMNY
eukprot:Colp12_sorted_trinity150504_noHs@18675